MPSLKDGIRGRTFELVRSNPRYIRTFIKASSLVRSRQALKDHQMRDRSLRSIDC